MPKVHRKTDITTGHGCFPPQIPATWSPDVFSEGLNVVRNGDLRITHCCPGAGCHPGVYVGQKCPVFANGKYIQLQGDPLDCGDFVNTHSPKWDTCSKVLKLLKPQILVAPTNVDFGSRPVGNKQSPVNINMPNIGELDLPMIPIMIQNVGGPTLIVQFAGYGISSHIGCRTQDPPWSSDEFPDFVFKNYCFPVALPQGGSHSTYVNFEPKSIGYKQMTFNIYSQPNQPIQTVTLSGIGI